MQLLRRLADTTLWVLAAVGLACALVWGATAIGLIKPLIVISGSMEPGIMTGDLVVDVPVDTADLAVGDVVSLPSDLTHNLVTHRIEKIVDLGGGEFQISMKGDNNAASDALDYFVGAQVWQPALQLSGWGTAVQRLTTPAVAVPLVTGLIALLGITLLLPAPVRRRPVASSTADVPTTDAAPLVPRADTDLVLR
jgi:signal peptidase